MPPAVVPLSCTLNTTKQHARTQKLQASEQSSAFQNYEYLSFFLSIYTQIHSLKYKDISQYYITYSVFFLRWENAFKQNGFFHFSPQFVLMHLLWKRRASADIDCCVKWENDLDVDANI